MQGGGHPLGEETSLEKKLKKLSEELKKELNETKQLIPIEVDTHNKYSIVNILNKIPKFVEAYPEFHVDEQGDCYAFMSNVIFTKGGLTSKAVVLLNEEQLIEALKEIGYEFKRKKKKVLTLANLSFLETYQNLLFGESGNLYVNNKYFLPHSRLYVLTLYKDKEINVEYENEKSYVLKIKEANGSNVGSTLFLPKELNDIAYAVKEVK